MKPFEITESLKQLHGTYPDAQKIRVAVSEGTENGRIAIAQLWLSEGIPYAFRECPAFYESVRTWLGYQLGIHAKEISVTGSGRLGESLSPEQLGKKFDNNSDLDFFVVSPHLFTLMVNDFKCWSADYRAGKLKPRNKNEKKYWQDHQVRGPKIIKRGFIDSKMIPNFPKYKTSQGIAQSMWKLKKKIESTPDIPTISGSFVRCYRDWKSCVDQIQISLKTLG